MARGKMSFRRRAGFFLIGILLGGVVFFLGQPVLTAAPVVRVRFPAFAERFGKPIQAYQQMFLDRLPYIPYVTALDGQERCYILTVKGDQLNVVVKERRKDWRAVPVAVPECTPYAHFFAVNHDGTRWWGVFQMEGRVLDDGTLAVMDANGKVLQTWHLPWDGEDGVGLLRAVGDEQAVLIDLNNNIRRYTMGSAKPQITSTHGIPWYVDADGQTWGYDPQKNKNIVWSLPPGKTPRTYGAMPLPREMPRICGYTPETGVYYYANIVTKSDISREITHFVRQFYRIDSGGQPVSLFNTDQLLPRRFDRKYSNGFPLLVTRGGTVSIEAAQYAAGDPNSLREYSVFKVTTAPRWQRWWWRYL